MFVEKRNHFVDSLKGFAIVLVVLGHSIQFGTYDGVTTKGVVFSFIYSFHMPLFMFLSGYVAKPDGTLRYAKDRFLRLFVPFESYAFLVCIKECIRFGSIIASAKHFLYLQLFPNNGGLWFVYVLFFLHIILNLMIKMRASNNLGITCCISACVIISAFYDDWYLFGLKYILQYLIFFLVGFILKNYAYISEVKGNFKNYAIALIEMGIMLTWRFEDLPIMFGTFNLHADSVLVRSLIFIYNFFVPFVGIDFSRRVISSISNVRIVRIELEKLGKMSLEIYFIHGLFIIELASVIKHIVSVPESLLVVIIFGLTFLFTLVISKLINKNNVARRLCFGK